MNIIQVASSFILANDKKFPINSNNKGANRHENNNIKSIVLPRIQTSSYQNISPHNTRNNDNYGHHMNHHSEMTSLFNNKYMIQKNVK